MGTHITIGGRRVGAGEPTYVVAELSGNHRGDFERAVELVRAAKAAGADAVKLQTYTADTITLDCDAEEFFVASDHPTWSRRRLWDLYAEAHTPWEWHPRLQRVAAEVGLDLFSSPFDESAVDFLEALDVPAYKVASFEIVDLPLIARIARTGKPIIMSTGMATLEEIGEAVTTARGAGAREIALLKCTSAYPAPPDEMNLAAIPRLAREFDVVVGLSDHTLAPAVAVAAVAMGASIVEKHVIRARADGGPDASFSLEPAELRDLVGALRTVERARGTADLGLSAAERGNRAFRPSLYVTADLRAGDVLSAQNVRSLRPAFGLPPREYPRVLGRRAARDIRRGTPLAWELIDGGAPRG